MCPSICPSPGSTAPGATCGGPTCRPARTSIPARSSAPAPGTATPWRRREGIYSSTISDWKRQKREGVLSNDGSRRPDGRGGPSYAEVDRLRRENAKLQDELAKAKFVIEVQGKVSALLEELSKSADSDPNET